MAKFPYEIPSDVRDLTAKSVEEARKAFERFVEATRTATAQAESTADMLQSSVKDVSSKALSFTEANIKAAFEHAQKLIQSKDPQEFLAHQSEYVKSQLAAMQEHAKELSASVFRKSHPKSKPDLFFTVQRPRPLAKRGFAQELSRSQREAKPRQ